jgi:hypothetical protein
VTPVKCAQCGASIDPLALACTYCRFTTPAGVLAHQRAEAEAQKRSAWDAQAEYNARQVEQRRLERSSTHALVWSIAGLLLCCFPVGVVGIVMGSRARARSNKLRTPVPARATVGFVLGIVSCITSVGFLVFALVQNQMQEGDAQKRIAAIETRIGTKASAAVIDHDTACGLAELHTLRTGWAGSRGYTFDGFECAGKLDVRANGAQLDDFRFKSSTNDTKRFELTVCLKRGAQWYVSEMRDGSCPPKD